MIQTLDTKYGAPYEMELNNPVATGTAESENVPCIPLVMVEQTLQHLNETAYPVPLEELQPSPPPPLPSFNSELKTLTGKIISSNEKLDEIFDLVCNGGGSAPLRPPCVIKSEPLIDNNYANDVKHFCSLCNNKAFKAERYYKQHFNSVHVYSGPKQFKCMLCQRSFHTERALQKHIDHEVYKPFSCNECNRTFNRKPDLMRHSFVHLKAKPYICEACQKSFIRRDQLTSHYRNCTANKSN